MGICCNLRWKFKVINERIRYQCDECEETRIVTNKNKNCYNSRWKSKVIHEGIRNPCDGCEFVTTQGEYLKL